MKLIIAIVPSLAIAIVMIAIGLVIADSLDPYYEDNIVGRDSADDVGGYVAISGLFGSVAFLFLQARRCSESIKKVQK